MPVDPQVSAQLLREKPDFDMPSAEGHGGYPADLLDMSADELRKLAGKDAPPNGNGHGAARNDNGTAAAANGADRDDPEQE